MRQSHESYNLFIERIFEKFHIDRAKFNVKVKPAKSNAVNENILRKVHPKRMRLINTSIINNNLCSLNSNHENSIKEPRSTSIKQKRKSKVPDSHRQPHMPTNGYYFNFKLPEITKLSFSRESSKITNTIGEDIRKTPMSKLLIRRRTEHSGTLTAFQATPRGEQIGFRKPTSSYATNLGIRIAIETYKSASKYTSKALKKQLFGKLSMPKPLLYNPTSTNTTLDNIK